jgi:aspartate aminotransferase-like enzyme
MEQRLARRSGNFAQECFFAKSVFANLGFAGRLLRAAREKHGIVFAGGQGALSGRIIRIGHLGWVSDAAIDTALEALAASLKDS